MMATGLLMKLLLLCKQIMEVPLVDEHGFILLKAFLIYTSAKKAPSIIYRK